MYVIVLVSLNLNQMNLQTVLDIQQTFKQVHSCIFWSSGPAPTPPPNSRNASEGIIGLYSHILGSIHPLVIYNHLKSGVKYVLSRLVSS